MISNKEMNDMMKIVQALQDSKILLKGITKTIENETNEKKGGLLSVLLDTLGASLLGNLLTGKGILRAGSGCRSLNSSISYGKKKEKKKRICKSWLWKRMGFLMPPHTFTNFEIQKYYQNGSRCNGVYSRNNLPKKIKDGAYVINLDEYADVGTHWIASFCNRSEIVYFDSFGVTHVPEEIKEFVRNKNIYLIFFEYRQNKSVICGYFCIGFIDFMLPGKKLTDFTSMLSPYDFKRITI